MKPVYSWVSFSGCECVHEVHFCLKFQIIGEKKIVMSLDSRVLISEAPTYLIFQLFFHQHEVKLEYVKVLACLIIWTKLTRNTLNTFQKDEKEIW